jgi:hypothetical protein
MGQYLTDFSEYTLGESPTDWPVEWGSVTRTIEAGNPEAGSDRSLLVNSGGDPYTRNAVSWFPPGSSLATEVEVRFEGDFGAGSSDGISSPVICGSGTQATRRGYYLFIRNGTMLLRKVENASAVTVASGPSLTTTGTRDVTAHLSISSEGLLRAYVWLSGNSKPPTPTLSYNDPNPLPAGWVGFVDVSGSGHSGFNLYYFGVGTDGDSASTPGNPPALATPTGLDGVFGAESINLSWDTVSGADYFIYEFRQV